MAEIGLFLCPFQFASKAGMATALDRYRQEPKAGAHALYLEHVAACFNPRQGLLAGGRLVDAVRSAGLTEVLDIFAGHLAAQEHGLYEVRRVATARCDAKASIAAASARSSAARSHIAGRPRGAARRAGHR